MVFTPVFSLTCYDGPDDPRLSGVSPAEGALETPGVILSPGLGSREAPGDVVLEAGGAVGGDDGPRQLVAHNHVGHGRPEEAWR